MTVRRFRATRKPVDAVPIAEPQTPLVEPLPPARQPRGIRGFVAEGVILSTPIDPFMSLKGLAAYSGLSVRTLRDHLGDAVHPLPCFRVGGKILVRRSEFDAWIERFRHRANTVQRLVDEVLRGL